MKTSKLAAVEADLAVERRKLYGRISPILTADQHEKLKALEARVDEMVDGLLERISSPAAE